MSDTTSISLRLDNTLLQRIDNAAAQHGLNRTEYVLSWLPVRYDSGTETSQNTDDNDSARVTQRRSSRPRTRA